MHVSTSFRGVIRTEHADADSEPCALLGAGWEVGPIILLIWGDLAAIDRLNLLRLLGEVHALEEGLEAGVGAEGIQEEV